MSGAGTNRSTILKPTNELEGKGTARMAKETPSRPKSTPQKVNPLGGPGVVVQIDESLFRHKPKAKAYRAAEGGERACNFKC